VGYSFNNRRSPRTVTGKDVLNPLEAAQVTGRAESTRVHKTSTSEMFGRLDYN